MSNSFFMMVLITVFMTGSGCGDSKTTTTGIAPGGSEMLYQGAWKLTEVMGTAVPDDSKATLTFSPGQENRVSGNTGCNRLSGAFELQGTNDIKFLPLAITKMACMDETANATETKFTDALSKANHWSITNNQLFFFNGDSVVIKMIGATPPTADELKLNGAWELNYISGTKIAFDGLFPNKKPLIVFALPNAEVTGNGGCNGYSAKVTVAGNEIHFGDALSTMMACDGNGEPVFFKTLKTITAYSISENTLTMMADDIVLMRFTKK